MTLKDAQHIAHGLIQGYVGPDHKVWTSGASTAHSRRRFNARTSKAGRIGEEPKPSRDTSAVSCQLPILYA
jgi:hypothetical protein